MKRKKKSRLYMQRQLPPVDHKQVYPEQAMSLEQFRLECDGWRIQGFWPIWEQTPEEVKIAFQVVGLI